ncbi:unnamed protein product [Dovyalis caffra]|uniref:Uncharacterized protein n=1 Tax=Dovyalis caffra TaxID=77055 RepID=A0AAV1QXU1_9ROSI|nr:unnamed protein product [Dovyalis caffra]
MDGGLKLKEMRRILGTCQMSGRCAKVTSEYVATLSFTIKISIRYIATKYPTNYLKDTPIDK